MKWFHIIFLVVTIYLGFILWPHVTQEVYYLWDKTKDAVLMTTITYLLRRNYDSKVVIRISQAGTAFIIFRVLIEYIIIIVPSLDTPTINDILFCFNWAVVLYVFFYDAITKFFFKIRIYYSYARFWLRSKTKRA